jgi:hypothetical protein
LFIFSKFEDYVNFTEKALRPIDVRLKENADGTEAIEIMEEWGEINKIVMKNKDVAADSKFTSDIDSTVVSVAGNTIKYLAAASDEGTIKLSTVTVSPDSVIEKVGKKIPSLDLLQDFATQAVKLSKEFKSTANETLKDIENLKKLLSTVQDGKKICY